MITPLTNRTESETPEQRSLHFLRIGAPAALMGGVVALLYGLELMTLRAALTVLFFSTVGLVWLSGRYREQITSLRRQLRAEIRRAASRSRSSPLRAKLLQGIVDPLLLLDPKKRVAEANRAAKELLGNNIVEQDIALYLRQPKALDAIDRTIGSGIAEVFELTFPTVTERHFKVSVTLVPNDLDPDTSEAAEDTEEPAFYIVVFLQDVTQAKLLERMRVDFVANASHELRTPLSSLLGFIETLRGPAKGDPEAANRFLDIMRNEAQRMVRLIDDLLSLSRIELDRHVRPEGRVRLAELLRSIVRSMEAYASQRDVTVRIENPENFPTVHGDHDQLIQVFQNLIDNAVKYGRVGGEIVISAEPVTHLRNAKAPGVIVSVVDDGDGIAPEHIPRLTERFYRVDTARSRKLGGTGLGLAIVKHIVTRHRGSIEIFSELGKGTVAKVGLPLVESESDRAGPSDTDDRGSLAGAPEHATELVP